MVCVEPYSNSRPREAWIQCQTCNKWSHEHCTSVPKMAFTDSDEGEISFKPKTQNYMSICNCQFAPKEESLPSHMQEGLDGV